MKVFFIILVFTEAGRIKLVKKTLHCPWTQSGSKILIEIPRTIHWRCQEFKTGCLSGAEYVSCIFHNFNRISWQKHSLFINKLQYAYTGWLSVLYKRPSIRILISDAKTIFSIKNSGGDSGVNEFFRGAVEPWYPTGVGTDAACSLQVFVRILIVRILIKNLTTSPVSLHLSYLVVRIALAIA